MELKDITILSKEILARRYLDVFNSEPWNDCLTEEDAFTYIENIMNLNTFKGYIFVENENIVGCCLGFVKPWSKGLEYYMDTFMIFNEYQNKGYGGRCLGCLKTEVKNMGIKYILLDTEEDMPAYSFYLKNDFEILEGSVLMGINVEK